MAVLISKWLTRLADIARLSNSYSQPCTWYSLSLVHSRFHWWLCTKVAEMDRKHPLSKLGQTFLRLLLVASKPVWLNPKCHWFLHRPVHLLILLDSQLTYIFQLVCASGPHFWACSEQRQSGHARRYCFSRSHYPRKAAFCQPKLGRVPSVPIPAPILVSCLNLAISNYNWKFSFIGCNTMILASERNVFPK